MRNQWSIVVAGIVAGIVGAAGLLAPVASAGADVGVSVGPPAPAVKSVTRAYGDAPVRLANKRQQLALTFTGRRGDRVDLLDPEYFPRVLCGRVTLMRAGQPISRNSLAHWRLPSTGRYTFNFIPHPAPCKDSRRPSRLRLTRVVLVHPDSDPAWLAKRPGVIYAVQARVPSAGMLNVATSSGDPDFLALVLKGRAVHFGLSHVLLRPAAAALTSLGWGTGPIGSWELSRLEAGQRIVLLHLGGASVGSWRPVRYEASYDGAAVAATTSPRNFGQPRVLTFEGTAGSFLDPQDGTESHGDNYATALLGPDGQTVPRRGGPMQLPSSGTYSLVFLPADRAVGASASLRAAGVTMLAAMQTDGPPTRFSAPEPGRMVLAPTTQAAYLRISALHPGGPTTAFGFSDPARRFDCSKSTANSCGESDFAVAIPAGPSGMWLEGWLDPGWVYVSFTKSQSGPIDLAMVSSLPVGPAS